MAYGVFSKSYKKNPQKQTNASFQSRYADIIFSLPWYNSFEAGLSSYVEIRTVNFIVFEILALRTLTRQYSKVEIRELKTCKMNGTDVDASGIFFLFLQPPVRAHQLRCIIFVYRTSSVILLKVWACSSFKDNTSDAYVYNKPLHFRRKYYPSNSYRVWPMHRVLLHQFARSCKYNTNSKLRRISTIQTSL